MEVLQHNHDVLAVAVRHDGKQLTSSTLDGQIYFWDPLEGELQVRAGAPLNYVGASCAEVNESRCQPVCQRCTCFQDLHSKQCASSLFL